MRILYVALTRAKEKLIITGIEKDYKKSIEKKESILNTYKEIQEGSKIDKNIIKKYLKYIDWLELVYLNSNKKLECKLTLNLYGKSELLKSILKEDKKEELNLKEMLDKIEKQDNTEIKKKIDWDYKYKMANNILTKSSVTKIKQMNLSEEEIEHKYNTPEFLKEENDITPSQKGTLMHLVMQNLDEKMEYSIEKIEEMLQALEDKNIISKKEKDAIDVKKIFTFTKSVIWEEMKSAKLIEKERPFYINIDAKEIYDEDIDEKVLVQGIIDLYYITNDDKLVLVDYKTDRKQN